MVNLKYHAEFGFLVLVALRFARKNWKTEKFWDYLKHCGLLFTDKIRKILINY